MRLVRSAGVLLAVSLYASALQAEVSPVTIDTEKSSIKWVGKKVTGQHDGTLRLKSGTARVEDGKLVGGEFQIDMTTISVRDLEDPKYNKKLTDHLHSNDFFSTDSHPVAVFKINSAEPIPNAAPAAPNYNVKGTLSVKGITNEVSFPAHVTIQGNEARASGTAVLDRTKWNVRYNSGKFFSGLGDKLIYDDFEVAIDVTGTVQS